MTIKADLDYSLVRQPYTTSLKITKEVSEDSFYNICIVPGLINLLFIISANYYNLYVYKQRYCLTCPFLHFTKKSSLLFTFNLHICFNDCTPRFNGFSNKRVVCLSSCRWICFWISPNTVSERNGSVRFDWNLKLSMEYNIFTLFFTMLCVTKVTAKNDSADELSRSRKLPGLYPVSISSASPRDILV